jgi:hypothetical protein
MTYRYEIYTMFDSLVLLGMGRTVFMGSTPEALTYFSSLGFVCPPLINQADFLMDCVAGVVVSESMPDLTSLDLTHRWELRSQELVNTWGANLQQGLAGVAQTEAPHVWEVEWATQLRMCTLRAITQQTRGASLLTNALLVLLAGGMLGQIYSDVQLTQVPTNNFLTTLAVGLTSVQSSLACFGAERAVHWREASRGVSKSAYFLAKNISQVPYILLAPMIYLSLYYTFTAPRATFWGTYLILAATQFCVTGVGNLVSIVCPTSTANVAAVVAVLLFVITSGYNPTLADLANMNLQWLTKLSYARWLMEALFINEMKRYPTIWVPSFEHLYKHFGYQQSIAHMHQCIYNLLYLGGTYRLAAFVALLFTHQDKQRVA